MSVGVPGYVGGPLQFQAFQNNGGGGGAEDGRDATSTTFFAGSLGGINNICTKKPIYNL